MFKIRHIIYKIGSTINSTEIITIYTERRDDNVTIYLDIIFLENLFMNFIILYACEIILKLQIKVIRTFCSSVLGSIYAIVSYISVLEIYSNFFLKLILSFSMVYIAFEPKNIKSFFKGLIMFYLTSFTFGGVAFALLYFINPQKILMEKRCFSWYISCKNNFKWRYFWIYFNNYSIQKYKRQNE